MRKLTDRQKVPRETLSSIIDSTGAPVCALLPFSTWAVFFAGLFYAEAGIPELGYGSAINTFCAVIPSSSTPSRRWRWCPLFSLGLVPKLGRMKKAYRRVEETGKVYSPESAELNLEDEDDSPAITGCLWDFVLPHRHADRLDYRGGASCSWPWWPPSPCAFCSTSPGRSCLSLGSATWPCTAFAT